MGQKTHPNGFRLITTQNHLSSWHKEKFFYKNSLEEDSKLRKSIEQQISTFLVISKIVISKGTPSNKKKEKIEVIVHAHFPTEQDMLKCLSNSFESLNISEQLAKELNDKDTMTSFWLEKQIEYFDKNLDPEDRHSTGSGVRKMLFPILREIAQKFQKKTGKILKIQIQLIENLFDDAHLVAKFIGEQLEQKASVNRVLKSTLETIENITDKGAKIQISGRLNGNDIARIEWDLERKIPLHTLNAKIDYAHHIVQTSSGILGIKIWLFTPEIY